MEGVEDIPGTGRHEGLSWEWSSFPEYLDDLDRKPRDIDPAPRCHRRTPAAREGAAGRHPQPTTAVDIAEMVDLAREAVECGALGSPTSRTLNPKSSLGEPIPSLRGGGRRADRDRRGAGLGRQGCAPSRERLHRPRRRNRLVPADGGPIGSPDPGVDRQAPRRAEEWRMNSTGSPCRARPTYRCAGGRRSRRRDHARPRDHATPVHVQPGVRRHRRPAAGRASRPNGAARDPTGDSRRRTGRGPTARQPGDRLVPAHVPSR